MCGLVGVAGAIGPKEERVFKELLTVDVLRGPHSTGVAAINEKRGLMVAKEACLPTSLFKTQPFKSIMNVNTNVLIGHNRYATQGAINSTNAHPFKHGDIVGVHNGTLIQQWLLPDYLDYQVDSENIVHSINKIGSKETWGKVSGAAALVWWNLKDETLHFLRNSERPMCYCYSLDRKTLFWASEAWMLEGILGRNGIHHHQIFETEIHNEYVIDVPSGRGANYTGRVKLKSVNRHNPYVYVRPPMVTNVAYLPKKSEGLSSGSEITFLLSKGEPLKNRTYYGFMKGDSSIAVEVVGGMTHPALAALSSNDFRGTINGVFRKNDQVYKVIVQGNSVVEIKDKSPAKELKFEAYEGPIWMKEEEFNLVTDKGCTMCTNKDLQFESDVMFDERGEPLCESCAQDPWVSDYLNYFNHTSMQ